ncbi:MAG: hypothetical protein HWN68_07720 [Desulfobacterales bacterium]|nr:hypothetical protein [Desulfobacterales bacterium]
MKKVFPYRKVLAVLLVAWLATGIALAYTLMTWHGTVTWTGVQEIKEFEVYNVPSGGTPLEEPWTQTNDIIPSPHIVDFYIENIGTVDITVEVDLINDVEVGCTAFWSDGGSYTIPVGTRAHAELALTLTGGGSYDFDFNIAP